MKAILKSEFGLIVPCLSALITAVIVFMCFASKTSAMVCALCAMWPMLILFSLVSYDNANGWGRYRAALSFSRRDVIVGRYASILLSTAGVIALSVLLGVLVDAILPPFVAEFETASVTELVCPCVLSACLVLLLAACIEPFVVKYGYVRGVRFASTALIMVVCFGFISFEQFADEAFIEQFFSWVISNIAALTAGVAAACLLVNLVSCLISIKIYEKKDL